MEAKRLTAPISDEDILQLKAGDTVLISGIIYTARMRPISGWSS